MEKSLLLSRLGLNNLQRADDGIQRIKIGLVDGSIDTSHPALSNANIRLLNGERCHSKGSEGCRHGTFMAGVMVASKDSLAPALCPDAEIISRPIFCHASDLSQCPLVTEDHLLDAIKECIEAGANIINLSLGIHDQQHRISEKLKALYDEAERRGILIVAASGNQGANDISPLFHHPWVIPVGASNTEGRLLPSSNSGDWLWQRGVVAPGEHIVSLSPESGTVSMSGTSVAAAITSGIAAWLWSQYPQCRALEIKNALLQGISDEKPASLNAQASLTYLQTNLRQSLQQPLNHRIQIADAPVFRDSVSDGSVIPSRQLVMQSLDDVVETDTKAEITPQSCSCGGLGGSCSCNSNVGKEQRHIYAVGVIKPVFPSLDLQKEFNTAAEVLGVSEANYYGVFAAENNPYGYIAEQMCWVMVINNINVYTLVPRSQIELNDIINSLKPAPVATDEVLSVAIGYEQGQTPSHMCAGMSLPMVVCNQVYYFTLAELTKNFTDQNINTEAIADVIKTIEFKPNDGASAEDRALNYLAFRYPEIYRKTASMKEPGSNPTGEANFLVGIQTKMSAITTDRQIVDVIFKYQSKTSGEQTFWYCGVDVTGQFPFLNTPLRTYLPVKQ